MKKLRLLYVLILISAIILPLFPVSPSQILADGANWLTGYAYRDQFTITGTADGIQTNYQLKFTINRSAGANSGLTAYVGTKCDATYKDIRFTKADGSTLLDYWIESSDASTATVWVEFDSIPASPTTIHFYFYYGNAGATDASSGANTFIFFDDFPGSSIDGSKWTTGSGSPSVSGGELSLNNAYVIAKTGAASPSAIRSRAKANGNDNIDVASWYQSTSFESYASPGATLADANFRSNFTKTGGEVKQGSITKNTNYHIWDVVRSSSTLITVYLDGTSDITETTANYIYTGTQYPGMASWSAGNISLTDWILIRNFTPTEPTLTSWAVEEAGSIPTVTTQATSSISYSTATGNGNITATGGGLDDLRGVCYSSINNPPTVADSKVQEAGSFGTGAFTESITGLTPSTHYYLRAYAHNSWGYAYGAVDQFDALAQTPVVTTQAATDLAITQEGVTSGTFNGNLTSIGDDTDADVNFEYGLTVGYGSATTPVNKAVTGAYTAAMPNNLTAGATYHYRSKATNAYGTTYGSDQSFVVPTPGGSGTTYYVAKTGNDSNSGLTLGNAFLTISKATSVMVAGDTTIVKAGTYNELVYLSSSGSAGNPITLRAYTGDTVIIDGTGISGNLSALIQANSRSYWDIEGFELRNCGESLAQGAGLETYGVQFEGGGNNIFRNLKIHAIFGPGIWIEYNTASTIVDGVEIYNTNIGGYDEALDVQGSYVEVKNCIVHDTSGLLGVMGHVKEGIEVKGGSSNMSIHHNESYNNNVGFQADTYGTGYSYVDIYNNYIHDNVSSGISIESEKGLNVTNVNVYNNILFNNNSPGYGGIEIDVGWNNFASVPQFNNILISNNTIYGDSVRGIYFWPLAFGPGRTYSGNAVRNNIIVGMSSSATLVEYADYGSGGVTVDYNLYYDAAGYSASNVYGTNSVIADPLLSNPAGGDFSIPTGSPAKDAGTATGAPSTDYIGTSRPQGAAFDIGAYEFITGGPPVAPSITISAATSIESTTATLNGNVTATGSNNPTVTVYWGTTDGGTTAGNWANNSAPTNPAQPQGINSFYYNATSLPTATTIYFRAKATNTAGTTWASSTLSFLTKPAPPTNVAATDGTYTNKTTITWTKSTGATGYYVYRSGSPLSALLGDVATYDDNTGTTPVIVPGTGNATDGSNQSWVGLSVSGNSVTTTAYTYTVIAVNATGNSAESGGNTGYIGYGAPTYQWQRSAADSDAAYGDLAGATTASYNDTTAPADGSGRWYKLTISATGAAPATSTANRGYRSTGAALNAPTVLTLLVSTFTDTTATAGGNITDIGSANVTQRGVCYGLTAYPDTAGTKKAETAGAPFAAGTFNAYLTGLTPSTLYHVRAYAINANGTSYGDDSTFTTSASTPMPPTMPSTLDVQALAKAFIPLTFLIIVVYAALKNIDTSDIGGLVLAGLIILVAVGLLAGLYAALP